MTTLGINVALIITGKPRAGDIRYNMADITKLEELYNFTPKLNFKDGLKLFMNWVNSQMLPVDNYDVALLELKQKGLYK